MVLKIFVISKVKNTVPWTYVVSDYNGEEIDRLFLKKNYIRQIKQTLELIKKQGDQVGRLR